MSEMKMLFSLCILTTKRLSALVLFQISDTVRSYTLEVGGWRLLQQRQLGGEAADPGLVLARDRFSVHQQRFLPGGLTFLHLATQTDSSSTKCIQTPSRYASINVILL